MLISKKYVALETIILKEIRRFTRIWIQTLLPPTISMTLYFVIFGNLIGPRIGDMGGFNYIEYIAPGIIVMAVINNSYANVVSSFFSAKFQRHIEELLVAPIPSWITILGFVTGGVVRGLLVGFIVTVVALFFNGFNVHSPLILVGVILMTSILFSLGGFINAIFATKFDDISIVPTFVLTPLIYLGGVFYTIDLLPEFWRNVSVFNPILYMVNGFRYGMLGISDVPITSAFLIISLFIVILATVNWILLERGIGIKN